MKKEQSRELVIRKEKAKRNIALAVGGILFASELILIGFSLAPLKLCILLSFPTIPLIYLAMRFHTKATSPAEIDALLAPPKTSADKKPPANEKERQEAEISALQVKHQKILTRLAILLGIVLVSGVVAMVMQVISKEVCQFFGMAASGVFFTAVHVYRQRVAKLQMALTRQGLPKNISKFDLIRRCETFEKEMSTGSPPSVNPYPLLHDTIKMPEERLRELNNELLKCLRSFDQTNLFEIEEILTSRRSNADMALLIGAVLMFGSAFAFTRSVGLGFDSIPNLLVMGTGAIGFVVILGALILTVMDNQNLRCLDLWISEFAKEEPKPKLADSLFD